MEDGDQLCHLVNRAAAFASAVVVFNSDQLRQLVKRAAALASAAAVLVYVRRCRDLGCAPPVQYSPLPERYRKRIDYLNNLYNRTESECLKLLRMRRAPFFRLCDLLRERKLVLDNVNTTVEEKVAMFLHVVGHNQRFRVVEMNFHRSIETIARYFQQVLYAIGELRHDLIRPPSVATPHKIRESHKWYPYFKDCIGAIDGTHIEARVPASQVAAFIGRKPFPTQNVMAAVDFDLRFTYVMAGWEGSAHDAQVLADALGREHGLRVPQGKFYLVDAEYAARPGFLPPYHGVRYHLQEWGQNQPRDPKELFNLRHSSLRVTVERAFAVLKKRFKILATKPHHPHPYPTQVQLVLACCILHNWIISHGTDEIVASDEDWVPDMSGSQQTTMDGDTADGAAFREAIAGQMWACRSDKEFLNTPMPLHRDMEAVLGSGMATVVAPASSKQPFGVAPPPPINDFEGLKSPDTPPPAHAAGVVTGKGKEPICDSAGPSCSSSSKKRPREDCEDDPLMHNIAVLLNNIADAIRDAAPQSNRNVPTLIDVVSEMVEFLEDEREFTLNHLLQNLTVGVAFVSMSPERRSSWMRRFLAKNY